MSAAFQEQAKISNENQKFVTISFKPLSFHCDDGHGPFTTVLWRRRNRTALGKTEKQEDTMAWVGNKERWARNGQLGLLKNGIEDLRKKWGEVKRKWSVKYGH